MKPFLPAIKFSSLLTGLMIFIASIANATTYYSFGNSNPNTLANWWTVNTGTGTHPANFTIAADIFVVQTGCTYTSTAIWTVSGSVQIQSGGTLATGAINNTWTMTIGGTTSITGILTVDNLATKTFTGNVTVNSGGNLSIPNTANTVQMNNLTVASGGTITHNQNYASSNYLGVNGNLIINGTYNYSGYAPAIFMNGSGTVNINTGTTSLFYLLLRTANYLATGTVTVDGPFYAMWNQAGGSFHTNGQTVLAKWGLINAGGTVFIDGGSLTINSGNGGLLSGHTIAGQNGTVNVSLGTLTTDGLFIGLAGLFTSTFTQSGGTVNVNNPIVIDALSSYLHSGGILNITGSLTINSTAVYTCSNSPAINIGGTWGNGGTFTAATSTVTFNGTGNQAIGGSSVTTFNNLVINPAAGISVSPVTNNISILSNLTVTSGIFDLGAYSCNRTIAGGTFSMASNTTMKLAGGSGGPAGSNFPNNFSTNTINANSLVEYNGSVAQTIYATPTYGHLTLSTGNTKTAGGILTVAGNLTINTTAIFAGSSFAHSIAGNWYNNVSATAYTPGTSTVSFNGSSPQSIGGTAATTFNNLIINNATGVIISQDQTVNSTLTLTAGTMNIGTNNLILAGGALAVAGSPFSATKMIIADGGGEVRKNYSIIGSYLFPIGDNTGTAEYSPVTLNFTSGTFAGGAYAGVTVTNGKHPNNASTTDYLNRYWTVSNSGITSPSFTGTATYLTADISGTELNIAAAKFTGALPWVKYGVIGLNTLTTTALNNTGTGIVFSGISNLVPAVSISGGGVNICSGGSVPLGSTVSNNGTNTVSYSWTPTTGLSSSTISNPTATPAVTTTYALTVTDGNGITSIPANAIVIVNTPPSATIPYSGSPFCSNTGFALVTFTGTIGGSYSTSPLGASINSVTGTVNLTGSAPGKYTITYTVASSGGCPIYTTNTVIIINPNTWTGGISTNWSTPGNWAANAVPTLTCPDVTINSGVPYQPIINSGSFAIQNLFINPGAGLIVNNATLQIAGTITNGGTFDVRNGTLDFNGSSAQTIAGDMFVDSTLKNLLVSNFSGLYVSNSPGNSLKITGTLSFGNVNSATLYTGDNIVLVSTAAGTARVADITNNLLNSGNSFSGKVAVERYFPSRRAWRLVTAPLSGAGTIFSTWQNSGVCTASRGTAVTGPGANPVINGMDISPQNKSSLKTGSALTAVLNTLTTNLSANTGNSDNKGYFLFVRGDRTLDNFNTSYKNITTLSSGGKLQTGDQNFSVTPTAGAFTLIGNPYASPVDFSKLNKTNLSTRFYAWDPYINTQQGGYVVMDLDSGGVYVATPPSPGGQTNIIQSSQAIFVQTAGIGTASIKFTEPAKSSNSNQANFRPMNQLVSFRSNLYLLNDDGSTVLADGNFARFDDSFHQEVDMQDALKSDNVYETFSLMSGNTSLAINRRPTLAVNDTLFFKFLRPNQRKYQFEFVPSNLNATLLPVLEDSYTGIPTPLSISNTSIINFTVDSNTGSQLATRFRIVFSLAKVLPVSYRSVRAFRQNNDIAVVWKVENELNISSYEVEKSTDGRNFTKVNTRPATAGNGGSTTYQWLDVNAVPGTNFYRIKNLNLGSSAGFSPVVKVTITKGVESISVYPNPVVDGVIGLQLGNQPQGQYHVRLINNLGQTFLSKDITHPGGTALQTIIADKKIITGVYKLEITRPDNGKTTINVSAQ